MYLPLNHFQKENFRLSWIKRFDGLRDYVKTRNS